MKQKLVCLINLKHTPGVNQMQTTIKFKEITTREELLTRIKTVGENLVLSCGNNYGSIKEKGLLHTEPAVGRKQVLVKYTHHGESTVVRYI
jgi:hypothetical protein